MQPAAVLLDFAGGSKWYQVGGKKTNSGSTQKAPEGNRRNK